MDPNEFEAEKALLKKLELREITAFKRFYKTYSGDLLIFAYCLFEDATLAIKAVDNFFERLWIDANFDNINPPIHRFLYVEFKNQCFS
jgi:hypothetical protein